MEKLKTQITQTGFNIERLKQDGKIDLQAYDVLKQRNKEALILCGVTKRFNDLTDALGYLNRGGHHFEERNTLNDETIIAIANDIYYNKNGTYQAN